MFIIDFNLNKVFKTYPTTPLLILSGAWLKVLGEVYWEGFCLWVECRHRVLTGNLVDTLKSDPRGVQNKKPSTEDLQK